VELENKSQTTTNTEFISEQTLSRKVASNSRPKLPTKSDVHALKSTRHNRANPAHKQSKDSAVITPSNLQELNTDLDTRAATGKTVAAVANKKQTFHYKPAHHSAPFKTTPLPLGKSKLPPVCRPGSQRTTVRRSAAAGGIDPHGGKVSVASSAAKEIRKLVDDEGRKSVNSFASVSVSDPPSSVGRNSPTGVDSVPEVCQAQRLGKASNRASASPVTELTSSTGIPDSGGPSGDIVTIREKPSPGQTTSLWQTDGSRTLVATSAVIGRQSTSASAGVISTNEVSDRADAVVQSQKVKERNKNVIHSQQDMAKDSSFSFTLHRDG